MNEEKKYQVDSIWLYISIFVGLIFMIIAPFLLTRPAIFSKLVFTNTGQIGDTIGGITAPISSILGAVLVYYSFRAQLKANKIQYDGLMSEIELNKQQSNQNNQHTNFNLLNNLLVDCKNEFLNNKIYITPKDPKSTIDCLNNQFIHLYHLSPFFHIFISDFNYLLSISKSINTYNLDNEQRKILSFKVNNFLNNFLTVKIQERLNNCENDSMESIRNFGTSLQQIIFLINGNIQKYIAPNESDLN